MKKHELNYNSFNDCSSWTINEYSPNGEVQWHGLFYKCNRFQCTSYYDNNMFVIFTSIASAIFLFFATICIFLMGVHSFPRRHFYLTPSITFIAVLLLFIALVFYANKWIINGVSVRLVIAAIVLAYTSFMIVTFIAGRYSIFYQRNPTDFQYTKTENTETVKRIEEQQTMQTEDN